MMPLEKSTNVARDLLAGTQRKAGASFVARLKCASWYGFADVPFARNATLAVRFSNELQEMTR
jgi:hypothetical protein